jgi:hypothetical protein
LTLACLRSGVLRLWLESKSSGGLLQHNAGPPPPWGVSESVGLGGLRMSTSNAFPGDMDVAGERHTF